MPRKMSLRKRSRSGISGALTALTVTWANRRGWALARALAITLSKISAPRRVSWVSRKPSMLTHSTSVGTSSGKVPLVVMPDYATPGLSNALLGYLVAAVVGTALVVGTAWGVG